MDLRQLLQLKHKGISNRKIADLLGINRNTVNDYIRVFEQHAMSYQQLLDCSDQDLHDLFPTVDTKDQYRYQQLVQYFPDYKKELRKTGCTLYNHYSRKGPTKTNPDSTPPPRGFSFCI